MKVLHVPYTFAPDAMGGTELYVQALAQESRTLGQEVAIAAPGSVSANYEIDGLPVFRFKGDPPPDAAYGVEDVTAAAAFRNILHQCRPDIVHLHAFSSAVSPELFMLAKAGSARTVFTYHTPTVSCSRGTMMAFGDVPCDGVLMPPRCTACTLHGHKVPRLIADFGSHIPASIGRAVGDLGLRRKQWLGLRMRAIIEDGQQRFHKLMAAADKVVAVCDWVGDVLRLNGIEDAKLSIIRQGLIQAPLAQIEPFRATERAGSIKLAYFGRLDATKGVDTLIKAIRLRPELPLTLSIFGISQPGTESFLQSLIALAEFDKRITFQAPVKGPEVVKVMRGFDAICVPSTWLETGPLVVYEAFGAGVPVLGSRLGGIQELVDDRRDGLLISPGDVSAWAEVFAQLVQQPALLPSLARGIRPPRTMSNVAQEMHNLYQTLYPNSRALS